MQSIANRLHAPFRRLRPLWIALTAIFLFALILSIPSTTLHAATTWNYGRWLSHASPYSLRPQGAASSSNFITYSATPNLVSGNRGYTRQIVNTSSGAYDGDIAAELGITVPQLYKLRFAIASCYLLFDIYKGPSQYYIDLRLPEETKKRLIGPDFCQSVVYAVLHEFNPVRYPAPLLWPDYFPNICTPFTQAEIDYFLPNLDGSIVPDPAAVKWGDIYNRNVFEPKLILLDYCLNPCRVEYASSNAPWIQMLPMNGVNYDEPFMFDIQSNPSPYYRGCSVFDTDNPLLARPLFEVSINSDIYFLRNTDNNSVNVTPRANMPTRIYSESLTIEPGNQTQYHLAFGYLDYERWDTISDSVPNYDISLPYCRSSVNNGTYCFVNYAKIGDSVTFSSIIKPDTGFYAFFGEHPVWSDMGTAAHPIPIRSAADLNTMLQAGGSKHYKLMNNIDYAGASLGTAAASFSGVLDGNGFALISPKFSGAAGLFQTLTGTVKNLSVRTPMAASATVAGGVIAQTLGAGGIIENCYVQGANYAAQGARIGGIVGTLQGGTVRGCTVKGGSLRGNERAGGIAGVIDGASGGSISDCDVLGVDIGTTGAFGAGGIAGGYLASGSAAPVDISRCAVDAATTVTGTAQVGGIAGDMVHGTISDCEVAATLRASRTVAGIAAGSIPAGTVGTISRCRSTAALDASTSTSGTDAFLAGIYAATDASGALNIEDCEAASTYVAPADAASVCMAGIAAVDGDVSVRRCLQRGSVVSSSAAYAAHVAGVSVGGGAVEACAVAGCSITAQSGVADAIAVAPGGRTILADHNRFADVAVAEGGAPVSASAYGAEVAIADLQGAASYAPPYDWGTAWALVDAQLPALAIAPATGAASALRAAPSGTTLLSGISAVYINYDLNGTLIDVSKLRNASNNPIVDGTLVTAGSSFEVRYKPDAPFAVAGDYFFRVNLYMMHNASYGGIGAAGSQYEGWPDFFDGTGVRVAAAKQPQTARLKIVQAGENFYARPDGGTVTVQEYATRFTGSPVKTWTLKPGVGPDEIPLTPNRYYYLVDTKPPTKHNTNSAMPFYCDYDDFYMANPSTGARMASSYVAVQKTGSDTLYVVTKHNTLQNSADDEVRRVSIQADTALYANVEGGTFDLYMFPDLTNTSTPRFLRNIKISRGALQDVEPLFPAYYMIVQKTAPAGHSVVSDPIYFKLNGEGGVLQTTTHAFLPEMRGTQPGAPVIYLQKPPSTDITVHVRTLIVDDAYPNGLRAPVAGYGSIDGYNPAGTGTMQGAGRNIVMNLGYESMGVEYTDYRLPGGDASYPEYAVSSVTPQYFGYRGYVVTKTDVAHASSSLTGTGAFARLDAAQEAEYWVTFFIDPASDPAPNTVDSRTNEFGEID